MTTDTADFLAPEAREAYREARARVAARECQEREARKAQGQHEVQAKDVSHYRNFTYAAANVHEIAAPRSGAGPCSARRYPAHGDMGRDLPRDVLPRPQWMVPALSAPRPRGSRPQGQGAWVRGSSGADPATAGKPYPEVSGLQGWSLVD